MSITRSQVEKQLIHRCGQRMTIVGMDGLTTDGHNDDLNDPISNALIKMGIEVTDFTDPQTSDMTSIVTSDLPELLDRSELRLLENMFNNCNLVTIGVGGRSESLSDLAFRISEAITKLTEKVRITYGEARGMEGGYVMLDFVEKGDDPELV